MVERPPLCTPSVREEEGSKFRSYGETISKMVSFRYGLELGRAGAGHRRWQQAARESRSARSGMASSGGSDACYTCASAAEAGAAVPGCRVDLAPPPDARMWVWLYLTSSATLNWRLPMARLLSSSRRAPVFSQASESPSARATPQSASLPGETLRTQSHV